METNQSGVDHARRETAMYFMEKLEMENNPEHLKYKLAAAYRIMTMENLDEGGISGHISMKVPDSEDLFWVNPFGFMCEEVTPDNLIMVNKAGEVVEGEHPVNVAGFCIHSAIHEMYPDVHCIAHAHSPWSTLFSALDRPIAPIDQNCTMFYDNHILHKHYGGPVIDADDSLAIAKSIQGKNAVILANHGALTCGDTIETAIMYMVCLERACRLNVLAAQLDTLKLVDEQIAKDSRQWIANTIGFKIEFDALTRKVERRYEDMLDYKPYSEY